MNLWRVRCTLPDRPGALAALARECGASRVNILGLQINLQRVVLDITAVAGAGNLLGNLLCAIAGLLNPGGSLTQIVALLNQILGLLGL